MFMQGPCPAPSPNARAPRPCAARLPGWWRPQIKAAQSAPIFSAALQRSVHGATGPQPPHSSLAVINAEFFDPPSCKIVWMFPLIIEIDGASQTTPLPPSGLFLQATPNPGSRLIVTNFWSSKFSSCPDCQASKSPGRPARA
jgi:hypothetical protein